MTAIVGESGTGKSTIGALLLRFYDPDQVRVHARFFVARRSGWERGRVGANLTMHRVGGSFRSVEPVRRGGSPSMGKTFATSTRRPCGATLVWCRRNRRSLPAPCVTTSATASPTPRTPRWRRRHATPTRTTSSCASPTNSTPTSASAASACPEAKSSASPLRVVRVGPRGALVVVCHVALL